MLPTSAQSSTIASSKPKSAGSVHGTRVSTPPSSSSSIVTRTATILNCSYYNLITSCIVELNCLDLISDDSPEEVIYYYIHQYLPHCPKKSDNITAEFIKDTINGSNLSSAAKKTLFIEMNRKLIIEKLKTSGVITTDRDALIKENKYTSVDNKVFLANDLPLTFDGIDKTHCHLRKEAARESVTFIINGKPVKCLKYNMRGNGDCGFISLNLKRSDIHKAFKILKPLITTGLGIEDRITKNPTDHPGDKSFLEMSDVMILGYLLYGARVYIDQNQQKIDLTAMQNFLIGETSFSPDAPQIFVKLTPGHFDLLIPEDNIEMRKYAAHKEYYSMLSQLITQKYEASYGIKNHTMIDEYLTNMTLPLETDKIIFTVSELNEICKIMQRNDGNISEDIMNTLAGILIV